MYIIGAKKLAQIRDNSNYFRSELQKMGFEVLGDEDSPVMPIMLYNPAKIPAFSRECLKHKGGLIISDSLNHNSIVNGARGSGATIRVLQHNTLSHLERLLRELIADGQPRTHRPWKKIIVVVEGIYSMEGEICELPTIVSICKKYKVIFFIYLRGSVNIYIN
ncbi:putative serine C-palmitoyltransferase [Helianthus anomalus]